MTLSEHAVHLDGLPGPVADLDLDERGDWLAVCGSDPRWIVGSGELRFPIAHAVRFPLVRWIDANRLLVVNSRTTADRANAWVLGRDGREIHHFFAGDGIKDVLVCAERVVVTYFDEGVFSGQPLPAEGVAVLRTNGSLEFGYRSGARGPVDVWDCYCACLEGRQLWFFPYDGFPLVRLDLDTLDERVLAVPEALAGASALTSSDGTFWFHAPYADPSGVFRWRPGEHPVRVGAHPGPLRGLTEGRFLSVGDSGYTVMSVTPR